MRDEMNENWQRWEGLTVDGKFGLETYLGGSDHSGVFLTRRGADKSEKAVIKLTSIDSTEAEQQLARWNGARALSHPNLIGIFEAGRCEVEGAKLLYVVEEYAEENLAQILPERALTADETRGLLPPVLQAFQFLHEKGFVHGGIQPSNILAIGDRVKLSTDTLLKPGEKATRSGASSYDPPESATGATAAGDVWRLGMTVVEVLTQRLPVGDAAGTPGVRVSESVPEPFGEIARNCLQVDPGKRWNVAQIAARINPGIVGRLDEKQVAPDIVRREPRREPLEPSASISGAEKPSPKWPYLLGLVAVAAILIFAIARQKQSGAPTDVQSTDSQSSASQSDQSSPVSTGVDKPSPLATGKSASHEPAPATETSGDSAPNDATGVLHRELPQVSSSARRTIQGKIKVRVRVDVDAAGDVSRAKIESGGPSKYFSRLALDAARGWKFSQAKAGEAEPREWKLDFAFSRGKTEASATRIKQ